MVNENGVKPWWQSKTIWAAAGVFVMTVANEIGLGMTETDVSTGMGAVGSIVTGVLALVAIRGRIKAKDRIG